MSQFRNRVDHVTWACHFRNLAPAARELSQLCGVNLQGPHYDSNLGIVICLSCEAGLEIIAPLEGSDTAFNTPLRKHLEKRGEGLYAVIFGVPNLEEACERARKHGYTPGDLLLMSGNPPWAEKILDAKESHVATVLNTPILLGELHYKNGVIETKG